MNKNEKEIEKTEDVKKNTSTKEEFWSSASMGIFVGTSIGTLLSCILIIFAFSFPMKQSQKWQIEYNKYLLSEYEIYQKKYYDLILKETKHYYDEKIDYFNLKVENNFLKAEIKRLNDHAVNNRLGKYIETDFDP